MLENSNVQKNLAKLPIESSLDHLDHRSAVILKGLQILEKIQKIGNPQGNESPRNIQVNQITTLLSPSTAQNQKPQVVDVEWLAWICVGSFEKMNEGQGGDGKIFSRQIATPAPPFQSIYVYTHPVRFFLKIRGFVWQN